MTDKQKVCFNQGIEAAAILHDQAAEQYTRLVRTEDAAIHRQWAINIRRKKKYFGSTDGNS